MPNILLIEDDQVLAESLVEFLGLEEFSVHWLEDERQFADFNLNDFDLLVLDLLLKHASGEQILETIRHKGITIPILVITAKQQISDKETCFRFGADDYLTKPFNPRELVLRIVALLKRVPPNQDYHIGDIEIDLNSERVFKSGQEIYLTRRTKDLLSLLAKERGNMVSKEKILEIVWSDAVVSEDIIRSYIKELRKILPEKSIETYKGQGYLLK